MPEFSTDWSESIEHWPEMFKEHGLHPGALYRFLEIGCFEGRTTLWLLENVLTHPKASIVVVDPFTARSGQYERFLENVGDYYRSGYPAKVQIHRDFSQDLLRAAAVEGSVRILTDDWFDFIYVDGSHWAKDVLADAVFAWPLLRHGGLMVFDDYDWPGMPPLEAPGMAVDAFVRCYLPDIESFGPVGKDQFFIKKGMR